MFYIGFRIELPNRIGKNIPKIKLKFNKNHDAQIFSICKEGRVIVEIADAMTYARGTKDPKSKTGSINFSLLIPLKKDQSKEGLNRIVQIINVLGNGKLIREKISTFTKKESTLNHLPELDGLVDTLIGLDKLVPGLIANGCYYAPDALFE